MSNHHPLPAICGKLLFPVAKRDVHIARRANHLAVFRDKFQLACDLAERDRLDPHPLDSDHKAKFFLLNEPCGSRTQTGREHTVIGAGASTTLDVPWYTDADFLPGALTELIRKFVRLGRIWGFGGLRFPLFLAQRRVLCGNRTLCNGDDREIFALPLTLLQRFGDDLKGIGDLWQEDDIRTARNTGVQSDE